MSCNIDHLIEMFAVPYEVPGNPKELADISWK